MIKTWSIRVPSADTLRVAAFFAPVLAIGLHELVVAKPSVAGAAPVAGLGVFVLLVAAVILQWTRTREQALRRLLVTAALTVEAVLIGLGLAWLASRLLPSAVARPTAAIVVAISAVAVVLLVRSILPYLREPRPLVDRILLLGREDLAAQLSAELFPGRIGAGVSSLGTSIPATRERAVDPVELQRLVREEGISRIVVVEPDHQAREELVAALLECRLLGVEVEDASELYQRRTRKLWLEALDPERLVFSDGFRVTPTYRFFKRVLDIGIALAVLVCAAPLMVAIALAIRLDSPGPVLFRQTRVGRFDQPFTLFKFRSMCEDAEKGGPAWASAGDQRVTRVGRILRRFHLDELPQAFNVLRGDLSFVGPRPERPCFVEMLREEIPYYRYRHYVKPGVTGWAQVCAPYADSVEDSFEKLRFDLYYAREMSLGLDLWIVIRTAVKVLTGNGR